MPYTGPGCYATSLCCGPELERDEKMNLIEKREKETRDLRHEFSLLGMKFVRKTRDNYRNVKDELFKHVSVLLKNKLSRSEFEAINTIGLFGPRYLIGGAVKWHQPSALKDIAETLGCTDEYQHYIKLFQAYISERSIRSIDDKKISVYTDKEWANGDDDQVQDLTDVIDAVEKHFPEDVQNEKVPSKDEKLNAVDRNGSTTTADQNTTSEEKYHLTRGNLKVTHLHLIRISN